MQARGIQEILHFTTNSGVAGILQSQRLLPRESLERDQYLDRIFTPNAAFRRDSQWTGYVSLSITHINAGFFRYCQRWHGHEDLWWAILSFTPRVLGFQGVYFCTTNNIYSGVYRSQGPPGLEAVFAEEIERWRGNVIRRSPGTHSAMPTCPQAEVLIPGEVPTSELQRVYVARHEHAAVVHAQSRALGHPQIDVRVEPFRFYTGGP